MVDRTPFVFITVVCTIILIFLIGPAVKYPAEDWVVILKTFVEIVAVIMGGLWTYLTFIKNRLEYPYAKIEHKIHYWHIGEKRIYLSVVVLFVNSGKVLISLKRGTVYIRQVRPLTTDIKNYIKKSSPEDLRNGQVAKMFVDKGRQISWPEIGYRICEWNDGEILIEPGETEEIQFDFIVDENIETIEIITYFQDARKWKSDIGWKLTSLYDFERRKL